MIVEPWQWFLLGMMVVLTPSLLVLALLLSRSKDGDNKDQ